MTGPGARRRLSTRRLVLRAIDLEAARRLLGGFAVDDETWAPDYPSDDELGLLRLMVDADEEPGGWGSWQVCTTGSGGLVAVGGIGFHGSPDPSGEVEVGFGLVPTARGTGLAAEALGALVDWAAAEGAVRVYATTTVDNHPSRQTLHRAGLRSVDPRTVELRSMDRSTPRMLTFVSPRLSDADHGPPGE